MKSRSFRPTSPATPFGAKGLLIEAICDEDPVISFEYRRRFGNRSPGGTMASACGQTRSLENHVPEPVYTIPCGQAAVRREGNDITLAATVARVHAALRVAIEHAADGVSLEVIDSRTVVPLDKETIPNSVAQTNRLIIVTDGHKTGGASTELGPCSLKRDSTRWTRRL